jgi:chromate transporter
MRDWRRVNRVPEQQPARSARHGVEFTDAVRFWIKLGFINFGGPTGQIAIMHEELVENRRWISEPRFLHALNYCMLLPGPEAQQLAIYVGWLLHRVKGGVVAGIAFIPPAFFLILGLSYVYAEHGDVPAISGVFFGLKAAVIGIVAAAAIRIGTRTLRNGALAMIAAAAFVAIFLAHTPFPLIIAAAGLVGLVGGRLSPSSFVLPAVHGTAADDALQDEVSAGEHTQLTLSRSVRVLLVGLTVWIVPLVLATRVPGTPRVIGDEAFFFSKAALVTFGGAYAVLAYINQAAVLQYHWLLPGQMVTGLGLAESTPGPLIMVTEFVGFMGAFRHPGGLDPAVAGVIGATVTTWATFAPCFLWIFLGAPYIERLRDNRVLAAALSAITAAVVGVVLNLAVTFSVLTLFAEVRSVSVLGGPVPIPGVGSIDIVATAIALVSFVALWRFRVNVLWVIGISASAGVLRVLL